MFIELDVEDDLYDELRTLAEEEDQSVEELIVDILKDEFDMLEFEETESEEEEEVLDEEETFIDYDN
jgi:hypothetical protein